MLNKKYFQRTTYTEEGLFDVFKKKFTEEEKELLIKTGKETRHNFYKEYKKFLTVGKELDKEVKRIENAIKKYDGDDEAAAEWIEDEILDDFIDAYKRSEAISRNILKPYYNLESKFKKIKLKDIKSFFIIKDFDDKAEKDKDLGAIPFILDPVDSSDFPWRNIIEYGEIQYIINAAIDDEDSPTFILKELLGIGLF